MANTSYALRNEVGARLAARNATFGLTFHLESPTSVKVSLRSKEPYQVLELAERMGGGGHETAASFRIPLEKLTSLVQGTLLGTGPALLD